MTKLVLNLKRQEPRYFVLCKTDCSVDIHEDIDSNSPPEKAQNIPITEGWTPKHEIEAFKACGLSKVDGTTVLVS